MSGQQDEKEKLICEDLEPGDITIFLANSDFGDGLAFFTLTKIAATVNTLYVTDHAWTGTEFETEEEGTIQVSLSGLVLVNRVIGVRGCVDVVDEVRDFVCVTNLDQRFIQSTVGMGSVKFVDDSCHVMTLVSRGAKLSFLDHQLTSQTLSFMLPNHTTISCPYTQNSYKFLTMDLRPAKSLATATSKPPSPTIGRYRSLRTRQNLTFPCVEISCWCIA